MLIYVQVWNTSVAVVATVCHILYCHVSKIPMFGLLNQGQGAWQTMQKGLSCFLQKPQL